MTKRWHFHVDPITQPIKVVRRETTEEKIRRLKAIADSTGRRLIHVYLEEEKRQKENQR